MGQSIVYEGLSVTLSGVEDSDNTKRLLEERDFISVLNFLADRDVVSSSLSLKTEMLTSQGNISNIPNIYRYSFIAIVVENINYNFVFVDCCLYRSMHQFIKIMKGYINYHYN